MSLFSRREPKPSFVAAPAEGRDLLLVDLDGVVYRGAMPVRHAVESLHNATARIGYLTNNASRTDQAVATQLCGLGLQVTASDVVTSPQAAVELLRKVVAPGAVVLVVGGEGLVSELTAAGYKITRTAEEGVAAVLQGFAPEIGWRDLAEASFALAERPGHDPLPWIATNTDWTLPLEQGLAPGNGTMVSAVHTAVQRLPDFAGKPETPIYETAFTRFGTRNALMIGDRLDTDIKGAVAAGIPSLHVLTGVDRPKQLIAAAADMRPDYIVASLAELDQPYPETHFSSEGVAQVGKAKVRMRGPIVEVISRGDDNLNLLRAGCAAVWNSGLAIYGLKVPPEIYADHWL